MSIAKVLHGDSEFSKIGFRQTCYSKKDRFSIGVDLYKKVNPYASESAKRVFFEHIPISDSSGSLSRREYSAVVRLIDKNKVNYTIARKNGDLLVNISRFEI